MKKIVSLVSLLAVFAMLLVGCAGKFDMDKSIEKLKGKGLTEGMDKEKEQEKIKKCIGENFKTNTGKRIAYNRFILDS